MKAPCQSPAISRTFSPRMNPTEDARPYAAEQGLAEEEAPGMEAKSKEFVEKGAEVYGKF